MKNHAAAAMIAAAFSSTTIVGAAQATPTTHVIVDAAWRASFPDVPGLSFTCDGVAARSCGDENLLSINADGWHSEAASYARTRLMIVTNTTSSPIISSAIGWMVTAFAPGFGFAAPDGITTVGAEVQDINTNAGQYAEASFSSKVSSAGLLASGVSDAHACSVAADHSTPGNHVTLGCGVISPDSNVSMVPFDIGAGQTLVFSAGIAMNGAVSVPEPVGSAMLGFGMVGMAAARTIRRRSRIRSGQKPS